MKKLLIGLGTIAAVLVPIATIISCSDGEQTGPRGGLYKVNASGTKEYHGHHSSYPTHSSSSDGLGGGAIVGIILGILAFIALILLVVLSLSDKKKPGQRPRGYKTKNTQSQSKYKTNTTGGTAKIENGSYVGDAYWNGVGILFNPKSIDDMKSYIVGITGVFSEYSKEQIVLKLQRKGVNILLRRKTKSTNLWILGKDGALGKSKLSYIKPTDKIVREEKIIKLIKNNY